MLSAPPETATAKAGLGSNGANRSIAAEKAAGRSGWVVDMMGLVATRPLRCRRHSCTDVRAKLVEFGMHAGKNVAGGLLLVDRGQ
jgi:hypothetical protein